MTALLKHNEYTLLKCLVEKDIYANTAWLGNISGIKADKMLRGHNVPYLYVLRKGEQEDDYYVTFVHPQGYIYHQPFTIAQNDIGLYYEQGTNGPIAPETRLDDVLYRIMHCAKGECRPLGC